MTARKTALLVISDRASSGERPDKCEPAIRKFLQTHRQELSRIAIVSDKEDEIADKLTQWADGNEYQLILTAGGTGLSPGDVTPEATRRILDREIPGIPEAMRAASMKVTPYAALSRCLAGFRGHSMIVNLPGSPKAAVENLASVFDALQHGIEKAGGDQSDCKPMPTNRS